MSDRIEVVDQSYNPAVEVATAAALARIAEAQQAADNARQAAVQLAAQQSGGAQ